MINVEKVLEDWGFSVVAENRMSKKNKSESIMLGLCIKNELYKKCKAIW